MEEWYEKLSAKLIVVLSREKQHARGSKSTSAWKSVLYVGKEA